MKRTTARELTELAQEIPFRDLDRESIERVRANLRAAALAGPPPAARVYAEKRRLLIPVAAAALILFSIVFARRVHEDAAVERVAPEPEIVRLTDGHI